MMTKSNRLKTAEITLLALVWVVLIAAPVLFRGEESISWQQLWNSMEILIPLFIIFLLNRFVLVPRLFNKKKTIAYFVAVAGLIAAFTLGSFFFTTKAFDRNQAHAIQEQFRPPPPQTQLRPPLPPHANDPGRQGPVPPFANLLIFSILLIGFDTGLMLAFRLSEAEKEKVKLEKENSESQLAFLRNQVSPHFFMNTLNNIHSLIDFDSGEAKESIIRLSKLMRHLLYDSEVEKIPIQKEMDFIRNYIDLMKLRYSDKVKISLNIPDRLPDRSIPPLLFTSFVENAFKHGVSYERASYIEITFSYATDRLTFETTNSNMSNDQSETNSGIGIENSRKRLDLIYGDKYSLKIKDTIDEYYVRLSIPV
jgi:hypothetical protein